MRSLAFETFVRPARRRPQLWRLLAGLLLSFAVYVATIAAVLVPAWLAAGGRPGGAAGVARLARRHAGAAGDLRGDGRSGRSSRPAAAPARRGDALRRARRARCAHFAVAAAVAGAILRRVARRSGRWPTTRCRTSTRRSGSRLLPLTLAGLVVQTGAEELLFRGYLTQQLAARFEARAIWMGVPALAFGAGASRSVRGGRRGGAGAGRRGGAFRADGGRPDGGDRQPRRRLGLPLRQQRDRDRAGVDGRVRSPASRFMSTPYGLADADPSLLLGDALLMGLAWLACRRVLTA